MLRAAALVLLAFSFARPSAGQDYPAAGTGAFSWDTLGNQRFSALEILFTADGTPTTFNGDTRTHYVDGAWSFVDWPNDVGNIDVALALGGDTLIVGSRVARTTDGGETWE